MMIHWNPDENDDQTARPEGERYHLDTCRACGRPLSAGRCPFPRCVVYDDAPARQATHPTFDPWSRRV